MSLVSIPLNFNSPDFNFQVNLDGVDYGFRCVLNSRTGRYSLSIFTASGDPIVTGIALVTNWPIFKRFKDTRLPPGLFLMCDMTGGTDEPDQVNLGDTILLLYQEAG